MRFFQGNGVILLFATAIGAVGCGGGDGLSKVLVSGSVTYDGKAVEKGQIRFVPQDGTTGPITIASVDGGRYTTESSGGVPVGAHRVEIKGYDAHEYQTAPTGPGSPPVKQLLPDKYNRASTLTAELTKESGETLDFALER
jgi:hypothetical protein